MPNKVASQDSVVQHVYGHYMFEMEVHPNDDPEGLNKDVRSMHFDKE